MRVILDTNVFVSGVFFSGPPYEILEAWHHGTLTLLVSPEIMLEYERVGKELAHKFPAIDMAPILELVALTAELVKAPPLVEQVCSDPADDMFLACALASNTKVVSSGDKALLKTSGYSGIEVLKPRDFLEKYLK